MTMQVVPAKDEENRVILPGFYIFLFTEWKIWAIINCNVKFKEMRVHNP